MSTPPQDRAVQPPRAEASNTDALLARILAAVEKNRRGRLEVVIAVILSLAALASTWCGYQARQWGGAQSTAQASADTAERRAAEDTIVGLQMRTFDGIEVITYWTALRQKDTPAAEAVFARMRPQLRAALSASLAAGVLTNPEVAGPLKRPEYVLTEEQDALRLREEAGRLNKTAQTAGQVCGSYVLLTLMFALVLFFGGIIGTFSSRNIRLALGVVALTVFIVTIVLLFDLPISGG